MKRKGLGTSQMISMGIISMLLLVTVAYAGDTADDSLGATLVLENSDPTVSAVVVQNSGTYGPTSCTTTAIAVRMTATDANGWEDIDLTNPGTNCTVTKGGVTHTLSAGSCTKISNSSATTAIFECTGTMDYNDLTGADWATNCTVVDTQASTGYKADGTPLEYSRLESVNVVDASAAWTGIDITSTEVASDSNPITTNNCGNARFAVLNVTAYDLAGVTTPAEEIVASDFTGGATDAANQEVMSDGAPVTIVDAALLIGAGANEEIFFYLESISTPVSVQSYAAGTSWSIEVSTATNTN